MLGNYHAALLGEVERYKLLVESIEDYAIFLLSPEGIIQSWNKGAQKTKGYRAEEIIGKHFSIFYRESDKEARKPQRELELAQQYGRVEDEDWRVRSDGSRFWANVVITALRGPDGALVGFAKVTRDLTERKKHEDALRQSNAVLLQQQRELERLNAAKDEFISLASHQLRTPATIIKQLLGMLKEGFYGEVPEHQLAPLLKAYSSNERQIGIVNDLLRIAQTDSGRLIIVKTPVSVRELLMELTDARAETFAKRRQTLAVDLPATFAESVLADRTHFGMVLDNLIDNASKYTPEGGSIRIGAARDGESAIISVRDTGVGISPEDVGKLYQKFSRIPNALSDKVGGNGLGLYWARKVVSLHKGSISVESRPGKGTTFYVRMPLAGRGSVA